MGDIFFDPESGRIKERLPAIPAKRIEIGRFAQTATARVGEYLLMYGYGLLSDVSRERIAAAIQLAIDEATKEEKQ